MVYRNNAGRLGAGFISACLETRWLGQNRGFYEPKPYCMQFEIVAICTSMTPSCPDSDSRANEDGH